MTCNIHLDLPGGLKMPALGYGTWQSKDDTLEKSLEIALEVGYRHIDTAAVYENEEIIGKVLKRWFDSGKLKRDEVFVTTKLPAPSLQPENVEECLYSSLKKLQLDYVDLYLIHFPVCMIFKENGDVVGDPNTNHIAVWKKMEEQVDAGRTKTIGLSNFNVNQVDRILKTCRIKPANLQIELHVYMQQRELVDFCKKNGMTVVAYAPLGSRGYNEFLEKRGMPKKNIPDLLDNAVVKKIAAKHSKTAAQVLLRHLIQLGIAAIPKSVTESRIRENMKVFDFSLDETDMSDLYDLEVGTSMRICDFKAFRGLSEHPEFPF